jgi:hypothetical protein
MDADRPWNVCHDAKNCGKHFALTGSVDSGEAVKTNLPD